MKKLIFLLSIIFTMGAFSAQAQEMKSKPVTTPGDKVHNVVHPRHKRSHGRKYKHESTSGKVSKTKVVTPASHAMKPKEKEKVKSN